MPHLHTGDYEHDFTTTAFVVRTDGQEPLVLLHMHRKLGKLLPVGGHVELHETPWQAIAHEIEEESGYTLDQLQVLQPKARISQLSKVVLHPYPVSMQTHDFPGKHYHTDIEYAFVVSSEPSHSAVDGESTDLRWMTKQELLALDEDAIYKNVQEIYTFILDHVLEEWEATPTDAFTLQFPKEYIRPHDFSDKSVD